MDLKEVGTTTDGYAVVVPLDDVALQSVMGLSGHEKRRGSPYRLPTGQWCIPLWHPQKLVFGKASSIKYMYLSDLLRIKQFADEEILPPSYVTHLQPTLLEVLEFMQNCHGKRVGFDIESSLYKQGTREMLMFSLAYDDGTYRGICVPLVDRHRQHLWEEDEELEILDALAGLLADPGTVKIIQNANYDMTVMFQRYGMKCWPIEDTMLMQNAFLPDLPADLGSLTSLYTYFPYFKDTGLSHIKNNVAAITPEELEQLKEKYGHYKHEDAVDLQWLDFQNYSAMDSVVLLGIERELRLKLEGTQTMNVYEHARECIPMLLEAQTFGFRMDTEGMKAEARACLERITELQHELNRMWCEQHQKSKHWCARVEELETEIREKTEAAHAKGKAPQVQGKQKELKGLLEFNTKSTPQKLEFFYAGKRDGGQAFQMPTKEPTGKRAIKALIGKGAVGAKEVQEQTQLRDDHSKYWTITLDADARGRCNFRAITDNGRFSCKKTVYNTGFNFQNQPSRMKKYMVADPGHVIINADLSQVQYRIVAWEAREELLMNAFAKGEDAYCAIGGRIFGKDPSEVSREKGSSSLGGGEKSERDWAKTVGLATLFGMGPHLLAYQLEISISDAMFLYKGIQKATPGIWNTYHPEIKDELYKTGQLVNCFGRKRVFLGDPNEVMRDALAYKPQRTEQDLIVQRGMLPIWRKEEPEWENWRIMNQVHDSIVLQCPLMNVDDAQCIFDGLHKLKERLEKPFEIQGNEIVIPLEVEVGYNCLEVEELDLYTEGALATLISIGEQDGIAYQRRPECSDN